MDLKSPSLQYAFALLTEKGNHNFYRINNVPIINTGLKNNRSCRHILDKENKDVIKIESLIQKIIDTGEFTGHRPFHSDPYQAWLIEETTINPQMIFSIIDGKSYTWYYLHDKEVEEAGLHQIAIELEEIFVRLKKELKNQ